MTYSAWPSMPVIGLALLCLASAANAMPNTGPRTATVDSQIIQVHGCHRSCEWGSVLGWHRHGAACRPIRCVPRAAAPNRCWVDWRGIRHCRW